MSDGTSPKNIDEDEDGSLNKSSWFCCDIFHTHNESVAQSLVFTGVPF
jgi:hypothetical protein